MLDEKTVVAEWMHYEVWDDGKGSHVAGYSLPCDRTPERRAAIIAQVRMAVAQQNTELYRMAIDAVMNYDPVLYSSMTSLYDSRMRNADNERKSNLGYIREAA